MKLESFIRRVVMLELAVAVALLGVCHVAYAFKPVPVKVLSALDVFESVGAQSISFGKELKLPLKKTKDVRSLLSKGFQVRIFRTESTWAHPHELADFKPCLVFSGAVLPIKSNQPIEEISIGPLLHLSWLTLALNQPASNGYFLIVLEPLGRDSSLVRVERGSAANEYFEGAIHLEVQKKIGLNQQDINQAVLEAAASWAKHLQDASSADSSLDCMTKYKQIGFNGDDAQVACWKDFEKDTIMGL